MKKCIAALLLLFMTNISYAQERFILNSPDKKTSITIKTGERSTWSIEHDGTSVLTTSEIGIQLSNGTFLGRNTGKVKSIREAYSGSFKTPFYRKSEILDEFNELRLETKKDMALFLGPTMTAWPIGFLLNLMPT